MPAAVGEEAEEAARMGMDATSAGSTAERPPMLVELCGEGWSRMRRRDRAANTYTA